MKKPLKIALIVLGTLFAIYLVIITVGGIIFMMNMDPDANSFSELFHNAFVGKERRIDVYPFDITQVDTLFYSSSHDYLFSYTDPEVWKDKNVEEYMTLSEEQYDTLKTIYDKMKSYEPHSEEWQQCVDAARAHKWVIVFCNTAIPPYRYELDTEENVTKELADVDNVTYH